MIEFWSAVNLIVGVACVIWLLGGLKRQRQQWNPKTRDLWYSRVMWALTQCSISIEMLLHKELVVSSVFITAAGLVTLKALGQKGSWGFDADKEGD